jgi:hypothetical protein
VTWVRPRACNSNTSARSTRVPELDVFDGIAVKTPGGLRFTDADEVADITDR